MTESAQTRRKFKVIAIVKAVQRQKWACSRENLANNLWATWVQAKGVEVAREQALEPGSPSGLLDPNWAGEGNDCKCKRAECEVEYARILHKRCENYLIAISRPGPGLELELGPGLGLGMAVRMAVRVGR